MKTKLLVSLIVLTATGVQAQNTAQAVQFRNEMCGLVGKQAGLAYKFKEQGKYYDVSGLPDTPIRVLTLWGVNNALTASGSVDSAFRVALAKCMDNIDRVYRDDRAGLKTADSDLQ